MSSKCRPGSLGRGDLCRTAIAFDLACRALACPVPHKTAVKLSGLPSEALYVAALGTAQRSANTDSSSPFDFRFSIFGRWFVMGYLTPAALSV